MTGEGGMVLAARSELCSRIRTLALHGMSTDAWKRFGDSGYKHYQVVECGFKYNMMDLQAAIGIRQLERLEANWIRRRGIWQKYQRAFAGLPLGLPPEERAGARHAYHLYTILIDERKTGVTRDEFLQALTRQRIGAGVHYLSIPEHPYYRRRFGWDPADWPHAAEIGRQTASLPLSAELSDEDVDDVITAVRRTLQRD